MPRHRSWPATAVTFTVRVDSPVAEALARRAREQGITLLAAARRLVTTAEPSPPVVDQPKPWPPGTSKVHVRLLPGELKELRTAQERTGLNRQAIVYSLLASALETIPLANHGS